MWRTGTAAGAGTAALAALSLILAGCAGSDPASEPDSAGPSAGGSSTEELFVGECGSMTDEELASITGIPRLVSTSKNAVRCRWDAPDSGAYAMFTWYRGSPIDRERTVAGRIGREIADIDADGHPGFTARGNDLSCEAGVESGNGFLHWSVNYAFATPPTDSCSVVEDLARATVQNAK
nr:DUF3558 domain-containing protein [uncultured Rhodococcus sp.]